MDTHLARALVLVDQSRFDLAEKELRQALGADPDNALAHAHLAHCLAARDELNGATTEAQEAIRLDPEWPFAHLVLTQVYLQRNRYDEAEQSAREGLRLDPESPQHHGMMGHVLLMQRRWQDALDAAEKGLALDPEDVNCNNLRAMALTKLGRTAEAGATMAAALSRDPDNAWSHANVGWNYLHQGNAEKALEHFREALRLDPEDNYARAGMVEALKSRHRVYGWMLRYFLWMNRLSTGVQWTVILVAYFGYRFLREFAQQNPQWMPWIRPVLILYIAFVVMTWIAEPLFNLLLRLNRHGRYALTDNQRRASTCVGLLLLVTLGMLAWWLATDSDLALLSMFYFGLLMLPVSALFHCDAGWPRNWMLVYTAVLAALVPLFFVLSPINEELAMLCIQGFALGSVLSGFVANYLMTRTVRR